MFKIVGIVVGYYFFKIPGSILGWFIGSFLDRIRIYGSGALNPLQNKLRQTVFLETLFISMGKLAKADGHISQEEVAHVEQLMLKLGMTEAHRLQAIGLFKLGADPTFNINQTYIKFMSVCGHTKNLKDVLLVYLIVMATVDGFVHPAEEALLVNLAAQLGCSQAEFKQMMDMVMNQSHLGSSQVSSASSLEGAYKALGVSADSSDTEIKRAYRKLMSQYHPDKLMGQGLPEDMIAMATEQAKEIQVAHDIIKKARNI